MSRLIDADALSDYYAEFYDLDYGVIESTEFYDMVDEQPTVNEWIPIRCHSITDVERQDENYPEEIEYLFDCQMPEDNEEILICNKNGWVGEDTCYIDEGYMLDSGWSWIDDVIAWMPLPEPYKEKEE